MRWSNPHAWLYLDLKDPDGSCSLVLLNSVA